MMIDDLTQAECVQVLTDARCGHLGCCHENRPYVVPISFAYHAPSADEAYLYGFTTPGQKVEWMRTNPQVCVECGDFKSASEWKSVIVFGHFYELAYTPLWESQLLHAQNLLKKYSAWWRPGSIARAASAHRNGAAFFDPIFYRIRIERMTGRRATTEKAAEPLTAPGPIRRLLKRWGGPKEK